LKCNRKGHTASYCTFQQKQSSKRYDDGNESEEQELTKAQIQAQRAPVVPAVSFVQAANDFPSLSESLSQNVKHQKSWASVAQTPASNRLVAPIPKPAAVLKKALGIPATTTTTAVREPEQWRCMWDEQRRRDAAAPAPVFVPSAQIAMTLTAENLAIMRQSLRKPTCCWADFEEDD
jgi:hypothetical protein